MPSTPESGEGHTPTIPTTKVGAYAFENYPNPTAMAGAFGTPVPETRSPLIGLSMYDELQGRRVPLPPEDLDGLTKELTNLRAAQTLLNLFGDVEPSERSYLPLWAVYCALVHNLLEAQRRVNHHSAELERLLKATKEAILAKVQELELKLAEMKIQQEQDSQTTAAFNNNRANGYFENSSRAEEGVEASKKFANQAEEIIADLKTELYSLKQLLHQLETYQYVLGSQALGRLN